MINDNSQNILNKFTNHFKQVLINAQNLAFHSKQPAIEPEHLLVAILKTRGCLGSDILTKQKINPVFLNNAGINHTFQTVALNPEHLPQPSAESQKIIEKAVVTAYRFKHKYIGTEHLLWGLSQSEDNKTAKVLAKADISVNNLKQHLNLILKSTSKFSDLTADEEIKELETLLEQPGEVTTLDNFTIDLTDQEVQKNIDPVIGRQLEIERLIQILSRRTKNNPVLLGDAGVGKTAIIEGLAKRITENKVPDVLLNKKILNLDISSLIAGTMYRGEFESRLKQVINEIKKDPDTILFIDELHTIMGAGATGGSLDAANILKPALSRGQLRCIGATTFEEYKKHIESDKALERRFQPIIIDESSEAETYEILQGLKNNYEYFHQVSISDEAIRAAIVLSKRFLPDKKLPDKAIDLIDEAAAKLRVKKTKQNLAKKIKTLQDEIALCQTAKQESILKENYLEAMEQKNKEEALLEELLRLQAQADKNKRKSLGQIDENSIQEIIAKMTGIPLSAISENENKNIINLEHKIARHIFGQTKALETISHTIRKAKAGLHDKNKPLASFMFLGPSGVGKTATAKQIAQHIFGGQHNMVRVDMSEFSEKFNISKLIGSPAGYVGYKEGNKFTDLIKNKPYSLILFDEIEKAHPDVFNLLLPILEEGELTDATGRTVNFRNCIIAMTSNVGLAEFNRQAVMGFELDEPSDDFKNLSEKITNSLHKHFPPEFTNRLDNIIVFEPLNQTAARNIIKQEIAELTGRLAEQDIELNVDHKIINHLLKSNEAIKEGARSLKRLVDTHLASPLSLTILNQPKNKIRVELNKSKITIN